MKKKIFAPLLGAVVLGLSVYAGYRTYDAYAGKNVGDLLLANAEALAVDELDASHCKGPYIYAEVGTSYGEKVVRTHFMGDLDIIQTYRIERCYAMGSGDLSGTNYPYGAECISTQYGTCQGKHNNLYD